MTLSIVLASPGLGVCQEPATEMRETLLARERALADALRAKDRDRVETMLAADFVVRGVPEIARAPWLESLSTQCWDSVATIDELTVRTDGGMAVASFVLTLAPQPAACQPPALRMLITDVWIRDGDAWRLQSRHATAIPPPSAPPARPAPPPSSNWELKGELSLVATAGNTSAQTLGAGSEFTRRRATHVTRANVVFVTSEADGVTKARSLTAQLRHGFRVGTRAELFARFGYARDRFAGIQHRATPELGAAYTAVVPSGQALTVEAGVGATVEERLVAQDFRFATATGGLTYGWRVSPDVMLSNRLAIVADLATARNWRGTNAASLAVNLTRRVSLKVSQSFEYRNLPVPGFKRADMQTSAGLVVAIARP